MGILVDVVNQYAILSHRHSELLQWDTSVNVGLLYGLQSTEMYLYIT